MSKLFCQIEMQLDKNLPFVAYRKPNTTIVSAFLVKNADLLFSSNFTESGFVFAPFNSEDETILFLREASELINEKIIIEEDFRFKHDDGDAMKVSQNTHVRLIEKALEKINDNEFKKVVVSRKEEIKVDNFDVLLSFKKLLKTYQNAFVYVWFHPKVGLWLGASPETLLNIEKNVFKTMSLAGTQVYTDEEEVFWGAKELEEQQMVTNFIEKKLSTISNDLEINKKETIRAGNLLHLRTKVKGRLNKGVSLKDLIYKIHPTPAVCGLPKTATKEFINQNENYRRTFYTGFLGELNLAETQSSLFVNLRCMNVVNKTASIYIGGGITKGSNAQKEWEETVAKSMIMKKVL